MNSLLFAKLEKKIEEWVDENCETDEWEKEDAWFPEELTHKMAKGAGLVFDGIVESSQYTREQCI